MAFNLLVSLVNAGQWMRGQPMTSVAHDQHQPWILDTCLALWRHLQRWTMTPNKRPLQDENAAVFMQLLDTVALPRKQLGDRSPIAQKAAQILLIGLSGLLRESSLSVPNQLQLASALVRLLSSVFELANAGPGNDRGRTSPTLIIAQTLEVDIAKICRDADRFSTLSKDLQARTSGALETYVLTMASQRCAFGLRLVYGRRRLPMHVRHYVTMSPRASQTLSCLKRQAQY